MPLKIMTVDDSRTIRRIVAAHAAELAPQVTVIEAANGVECLEKARLQKPDVIILDVNMPIMNGEECLRRLKQDPATSEIPVVLLTTESEKSLVIRLLKLGVSQYIIKPFRREEFVEKVGLVLARTKREPSGETARQASTAGPYLIVVDDKEKVVQALRAVVEPECEVLAVHDASAALEGFRAKAPLMVVANLALSNTDVFSMFAQMRRVPDRQGVRYIGMCLRTAADLIARVEATGYIELLPKPFDQAEIERIIRAGAAVVRTEGQGSIFVVHVGSGGAIPPRAVLAQAVDAGAEEGFLRVLFDFSRVQVEELADPTLWTELAERALALGMRCAYVAPSEALQAKLGAAAETRHLSVATAVADGLAGLAA